MTVSFAKITVGSTYSRPKLAAQWGYKSYQALARGVVTPAADNKIILFVTAEKQESFEQYADRLKDGALEWEGPTDHFAEGRIATAATTGDEIHLFYRERHHSDFLYLGRLRVEEYVQRRERPSRFSFSLQFADRRDEPGDSQEPTRAWTRREVDLLVSDYLIMLAAELRTEPYSKSAHRRALAPLLQDRSDGSIERKHQNVSAVLVELGYPYVSGYKPLSNYQALLFEAVEERVGLDTSLLGAIRESVKAPAVLTPVDDLLARLEKPPEPMDATNYAKLHERRKRAVRTVNWLEIESQNRSLGLAGEEFAMLFERERLRRAGNARLADRVKHVSATIGDGEGYDIHSFEPNGEDRLIEVKTTAYGKQTPFFLSRNELNVSRRRSDAYHLYRLFQFREDPRLYGLTGALDESCLLDPVQYSARVK